MARTTTRARRRLPARSLLAGWCAVALLAACAGSNADGRTGGADDASPSSTVPSTSTSSTVAPEPVEGIVATIDVNRMFALDRAHGLGLRNVGDAVRTVVAVGLESPLYGPAEMDDREVVLRPGGRQLVMPVPYGPARCEGEAEPTFTAVVRFADGAELRVPAVPVTEGTLLRLHAKECAAAEVAASVALVAEDWQREGSTATGTLALVGRRRVEAQVIELAGNVIFSLQPADGARLRIEPGEDEARIEVVLRAERCDQHALAEVKRPFVFGAWVAVDGADPALVEVHPTGAALAAVQEIFATCGDAG